MTVPTWFGTG